MEGAAPRIIINKNRLVIWKNNNTLPEWLVKNIQMLFEYLAFFSSLLCIWRGIPSACQYQYFSSYEKNSVNVHWSKYLWLNNYFHATAAHRYKFNQYVNIYPKVHLLQSLLMQPVYDHTPQSIFTPIVRSSKNIWPHTPKKIPSNRS